MPADALCDFNKITLDGLEFCRRAYALFERIRATEGGPSRLRMRETVVEKKLIEELLPICKFVQATHRPGLYLTVTWERGNQPYDARITQRGALVEMGAEPNEFHLEVTGAMHENDFLMREAIDGGKTVFGVEGLKRDKKTRDISSKVIGRRNLEHVDRFCSIAFERISEKSKKPYPANTHLVVQCALNTLYFEDDWAELVQQLREKLSQHDAPKVFSRIFIFDGTSGQSAYL